MKNIIRILLALLLISGALLPAQGRDTITVNKKSRNIKIDNEGMSLEFAKKDSSKVVKYPKVNFGIALEHFDLGISKYHTDGDFVVPQGYELLEHETWKTHTFGFDALQFGLRFSPNFKVMISGGLEWNHIRLKRDDVNIIPDNSTLDFTSDPAAELKKNRLTSRYLRVPFYLEYRTRQLDHGKRFSVVAGPEIGFLIDGKQKQKTEDGDKVKIKDDFNFEPFRYGASLRLGYGGAGLFFKYYFNDVFADNQGPKNYKNLAFGLTFGF